MMSWVYIFMGTDHFSSFGEIRDYVNPKFSDEGDYMPSKFMEETNLVEPEPGFIEAVCTEQPRSLTQLLKDCSYSELWLDQLEGNPKCNNSICVYSPNYLENPEGCRLKFVGKFEFNI